MEGKITAYQSKFLNSLPPKEWVRYGFPPVNTRYISRPMLMSLVRRGLIEAVSVVGPERISDNLVARGECVASIYPWVGDGKPIGYYPSFIKRVSDELLLPPEEEVAVLRERVKELEKRLEEGACGQR